jgi:hypothetical protein
MTSDNPKYRGSKNFLLVYSELIAAAQHRGLVTYQEIADMMGLPLSGSYMGAQVGHMLGEISEDEIHLGRPMLSAVAVNVRGRPGPGFYVWARALGKLDSASSEDEKQFWQAELKAVYDTWQKELISK